MPCRVEENYKGRGYDVLILVDDYGTSIGFGVTKARLIQYYSKEIDDFIAKRSKNKESEE